MIYPESLLRIKPKEYSHFTLLHIVRECNGVCVIHELATIVNGTSTIYQRR